MAKNHTHPDSETLLHIHEDVPAEHYDQGIQKNPFQKYWHFKRFVEIAKVITPITGRILDVGCHSGTFTTHLLKFTKSQKIYGIDVCIVMEYLNLSIR